MTTPARKQSPLVAWTAVSFSVVSLQAIAEERTSDSANLEEVIVSAQKRNERLQDVPISVSVLAGVELDRATGEGITEALNSVPGVATSVAYQGGNTLLAVRGVSAGGPIYNGSSPVGYYLDSAPFGLVKSTVVPDSNAYDLERVEVLRGPQGTLYGASALNGVVRVLTHDADPDEFALKARTSASGTKGGGTNYRGDMAINVPIIEGKLAARAVGGHQDMGGWIDRPGGNDANDAEIRTGRLKINAVPTDELRIDVAAWVSKADYGAMSVAGPTGRRESIVEEPMSTDYGVYSMEIGYDTALFSISSMTSYLDYENESYLDLRPQGSSGTLFTHLDGKMFAQEIVLNSAHEGAWRWSAGGIYRDAEDGLFQALDAFSLGDMNDRSKSFALFGELTRVLLDGRLELTGGVRYFEDDVELVENEKSTFSAAPLDPLIRRDSKFDATSPRLVVTWHPNDDATVYASFAEGFRSGFNQAPWVLELEPNFGPTRADTLENYEVGTKGSLGDRVTYEAAIYFIDWQDVQQTLTVPGPSDIPVTATINGNSASGVGVDLSVTTQITSVLKLGINLSWNDLGMDRAVISYPSSAPDGVVLYDKGDRLSFSPEYTAGASLDYQVALGRNGFEGHFAASANYTSQQDWRIILGSDRVIASGDPMLIARTSFSVNAPEHWVATLFIDNINNEDGFPYRSPYGGFTDTRVRPRTIGMQVEYSW